MAVKTVPFGLLGTEYRTSTPKYLAIGMEQHGLHSISQELTTVKNVAHRGE